MICLQFDRVEIGNGPSFSCVLMKDFLEALATKVKKNTASFDNYSRMYVPHSAPLKQKPGDPLRTVNLFKHIQVPPLSPYSLEHVIMVCHMRPIFMMFVGALSSSRSLPLSILKSRLNLCREC